MQYFIGVSCFIIVTYLFKIIHLMRFQLPILTLKLYGCLELEKNVSQLVELIHSRVNTDTALHLQLSEDFRERLLSTMSSSFSFLVS